MSFKREELLYDIGNNSYIEGSATDVENVHNRHMIQDVLEEGNVDRVTRVLDLGVARCREMLHPYTRRGIERRDYNDDFKERKIYGIVMTVPADLSQTTLTLLERLIHEYLVCKGTEEWMSITNAGKAEEWRLKADEAEQEIRTGLHSRLKRIRRSLHPF